MADSVTTGRRPVYAGEWLRSYPSLSDDKARPAHGSPELAQRSPWPGVAINCVLYGLIGAPFGWLLGWIAFAFVFCLGWAIFGLFWAVGAPVGDMPHAE